MRKNYLALAMADALFDAEGFISITIPAGIENPREVARQIVDRLNERVPGPVPYALEIFDDALGADEETLERLNDESASLKTLSQAIKYRTAPKRAIVTSDQSALLSITNVFVPAVEWSFPASISDAYLNLKKLAYAAVDLCLAEVGHEPSAVGDRCRDRMQSVFNILKTAYEGYGSTASTWNGLLLKHLDTGLRELIDCLQRATPTREIDDAFFSSIFPSAGSNLERAVTKYWSTSDLILNSIASLTRKGDGLGARELRRLDWLTFDKTRIGDAKGNPMLALALHGEGDGLKHEAFTALSENDFFAPTSVPAVDPLIADQEGFSLGIAG
jgi:hypothetical protein